MRYAILISKIPTLPFFIAADLIKSPFILLYCLCELLISLYNYRFWKVFIYQPRMGLFIQGIKIWKLWTF